MRAHVRNRFPLLPHIQEPRRPKAHLPLAELYQRVQIFEFYSRIGRGASKRTPENFGIAHQLALNLVDAIKPFGHAVVESQMLLASRVHGTFEQRELFALDDPRLVGEHVLPGAQAGQDTVDLYIIPPRDHHNISWRLFKHEL